MVGGILKKIFGTKNERELKRLLPVVEQINSLEPQISALSDSQLKGKMPELKRRKGDRYIYSFIHYFSLIEKQLRQLEFTGDVHIQQ